MTETFLEVGKKEKKKTLMLILNDKNRDPTELTIIFVNMKKQADFITTLLSSEEKLSTGILGDRLQLECEEALYDFKHGTCPILDMPIDIDEHVHRIGRTGHVGNLGHATSFYDHEFDSDVAGLLGNLWTKSGVELPEFMGKAPRPERLSPTKIMNGSLHQNLRG